MPHCEHFCVTEPATPKNVVALRTSPTTIQVTWDEPSQTHNVAQYEVKYYHMYDNDMSIWNSLVTDGPTTVALITDKVDPDKAYIVRVRAISTHNQHSNYSADDSTNGLVQGKFTELTQVTLTEVQNKDVDS